MVQQPTADALVHDVMLRDFEPISEYRRVGGTLDIFQQPSKPHEPMMPKLKKFMENMQD